MGLMTSTECVVSFVKIFKDYSLYDLLRKFTILSPCSNFLKCKMEKMPLFAEL